MKRLFGLLFVGVMTMPSCSLFQNVGCTIEHAASGAIAASLSTALQCTNGSQVLADVTALVSKTNICSLPTSPAGQKAGPIANIICPALSTLATTELSNVVPPSWGCNPTLAKAGLGLALTQACELLPF